jgi:peptidoglycan/xylan/chitin deacetylase (PgdA/CDA1 family)
MNFRLLIALILLFAPPGSTQPARRMTVTIDDLPYVIPGGGTLAAEQAGTSAILAVLKNHRVPVVAFVNEIKLQVPNEVEARTALLKQWVDAGMTLGNHTYSHTNFNDVTIERFEQEIARGDIVSRRLMQSRKPYQLYFRHPMTHTGETQVKKETIEQFLAARGYKVTPHTIENSDFIFNVGYVRAVRNRDNELAKRLRTEYLSFTMAATAFAEKISEQIFGYEIPQTLLIHANDINAACLDEMLSEFEARGYRFDSLDEVMIEPVYKTPDKCVTRGGPTWLWRWAYSKGMKLDFKDDPDPPAWVMDLYQQR